MDGHGDFEIGDAVAEDESELIGFEFVDGGGVIVVFGWEFVEGEDGFDEVGIEGAVDIAVGELFEDVDPGVAGTEEESDFGEVWFGEVWFGEGEFGEVELEVAGVGEAELVEGDDGSAVGSDLHESDLGEGGCGEESEDGEEREESNGGHFRLSLSLSLEQGCYLRNQLLVVWRIVSVELL